MKYLFSSITSRFPWLAGLNTRNEDEIGISTLLIKGSVGTFVLKVVSTGLAFVISLILARLLGAAGYGIYVYVTTWVGLLAVLTVMGLDKLLVRNIAAYHSQSAWGLMRGLIRRSNQGVLVASLVLMILAAWIGWIFAESSESIMLQAFWLALILLPFYSLTRLSQSAMQGLHRVVIGQVPEMLIQPVLFLFLIAGAYLLLNKRFSAQWIIVLNILASAVAFGVLAYLLRKALPPEMLSIVPTYEIRLWVRNALPLLLINSMFVINSRTDIIMLGAMKGTELTGIYAVANRGAELITFALTAINVALAPTVAKLYAEGDMRKLQRVVTTTARAIFLFSLPIALILILFGDLFLKLFGQAFVRGETALAIMCVGQLINAVAGSVGLVLIMTGHERDTAKGIGISAVLNVILNVILIPRWGMEGAAIATASSLITWNFLLAAWAYKRLGIHSTALGEISFSRKNMKVPK